MFTFNKYFPISNYCPTVYIFFFLMGVISLFYRYNIFMSFYETSVYLEI